MNHYSYSKINKTKYYVKDGIIRYIVTFEPRIKCQCRDIGTNMCCHALYILQYVFELSTFVIKYLHHVYGNFLKGINECNSISNETLELLLLEKFNTDTCAICLNKLSDSKYNFELIECAVCHNLQHQVCISKWKNGCIICRS